MRAYKAAFMEENLAARMHLCKCWVRAQWQLKKREKRKGERNKQTKILWHYLKFGLSSSPIPCSMLFFKKYRKLKCDRGPVWHCP